MRYALKPGFAWNPLADYERNKACFCGSMKKFKKCCWSTTSPTIPEKYLKPVQEALRVGRKIKIIPNPEEPTANEIVNEEVKDEVAL